MNNPISSLNEKLRRIVPAYGLTADDDKPASRFSHRIAQRLVELARPKPGDSVLAVASGTGATALYVADKVAPTGHVVGIELTVDLLARARQRLAVADWSDVAFWEGELEQPHFDNDTFDLVLCSSAIFWLPELVAVLRAWRRVLKTGGTVAFSSYGERSFQPLAKLFETSIRRYGVTLPPSIYPFSWERLPDLEAYSDLLRNAAFSVIDVRSEQLGYYLANREEWWDILWYSNFRDPLTQLTRDALVYFKAEHLAAVAELTTAQGIWLNVATIFAVGQKG